MTNKTVRVEFDRNWVTESYGKKVHATVTSSDSGIKLGHLPGVDRISVKVDGKQCSSWNLTNNKRRFHI
jgi:uncharacterized ParB-like nuclease family protein